jgi:hypothetical protein
MIAAIVGVRMRTCRKQKKGLTTLANPLRAQQRNLIHKIQLQRQALISLIIIQIILCSEV